VVKRDRASSLPRLRPGAFRVELVLAPAPVTQEQLERWADQYLEYILEDEGLLPLDQTDAA